MKKGKAMMHHRTPKIMRILQTDNREELAAFFRRDVALYAYSLGDLDPVFFPHSQWWVAVDGSDVLASLLLYTAFEVPIIHGLTDNDAQGLLWRELLPDLPDRAYVHFRRRHAPLLERRYQIEDRGAHYKMCWRAGKAHPDVPTRGLRRLSLDDLPAIRRLYARAMPSAHIDPRVVELGKAFGWIEGNDVLSIATCHVFSQEYKVAAVGAVTTCPSHRRRGLGTAVTWGLTRDIAPDVDTVTLNVHSQNLTAIGIYERLGYSICHQYEEAAVN